MTTQNPPKYWEVTAFIEPEVDGEGIVNAYDYAVVRYVEDDAGQVEEVRLMHGQADDFDTAQRNLLVKLANLDAPIL